MSTKIKLILLWNVFRLYNNDTFVALNRRSYTNHTSSKGLNKVLGFK